MRDLILNKIKAINADSPFMIHSSRWACVRFPNGTRLSKQDKPVEALEKLSDHELHEMYFHIVRMYCTQM